MRIVYTRAEMAASTGLFIAFGTQTGNKEMVEMFSKSIEEVAEMTPGAELTETEFTYGVKEEGFLKVVDILQKHMHTFVAIYNVLATLKGLVIGLGDSLDAAFSALTDDDMFKPREKK